METTPDRDCSLAGLSVPDGRWTGPLVVDTVTETARASGAVYGVGDGELELIVDGGVVTGGKWTLSGGQQGDIEKDGATNHISSRYAVGDGVPKGVKDKVVLTGTGVTTGSFTITANGVTVSKPLNYTTPVAIDMDILQATCDEIQATFVPDWNRASDGSAVLGGTYAWTGTPG